MPLYFQMSRNDSRQSERKDTNFFDILTIERSDPIAILAEITTFCLSIIVKVC